MPILFMYPNHEYKTQACNYRKLEQGPNQRRPKSTATEFNANDSQNVNNDNVAVASATFSISQHCQLIVNSCLMK